MYGYSPLKQISLCEDVKMIKSANKLLTGQKISIFPVLFNYKFKIVLFQINPLDIKISKLETDKNL